MKPFLYESERRDPARKKLEYEKKIGFVREYKAERGCSRCGEMDVRCLDLHHLDPATKHPKLKARKGRAGMTALTYPELHEELTKCEVLCANCHRKEPVVPHGKKWLSFDDPRQLTLEAVLGG